MPLLHCCFAPVPARVAPPFAQDPRMPEREAPRSIDPHRSHFGSRYKSGCCGHAGLFRAGSIPSARARELVLSRPWIKEHNHKCMQTNSYTSYKTHAHTLRTEASTPARPASKPTSSASKHASKHPSRHERSTSPKCRIAKWVRDRSNKLGQRKNPLSKPQGRLDLAKKKHIQAGHSPTSSPTRKTQQGAVSNPKLSVTASHTIPPSNDARHRKL